MRGKELTWTVPVALASVVVSLAATPVWADGAPGPLYGQWARFEVAAVPAAGGPKASADLGSPQCAAVGLMDGDGIPDLAVGYGGPGGEGSVVVYSGNPDIGLTPKQLIWRAQKGLDQPAPFQTDALVMAAPFRPDWVSVGDFDGDAHRDLVIGSRTVPQLKWTAGDGRGSFGEWRTIALPGPPSAWAAGEIGHLDGLEDLVVSVNRSEGAELLVFAETGGAFKSPPQAFDLVETPTAVAMGLLDGDHLFDVAVGVGQEVVVFSGKDVGLSGDPERLAFQTPVASLAVGDFTGESYRQLLVGTLDGSLELVDLRSGEVRRPKVELEIPPGGGTFASARFAGDGRHDLVFFGANQPGLTVAADLGDRRVSAKIGPRPALAVVPFRINRDARDDLVILRKDASKPEVLLTKTRTTLTVNTIEDTNDGTCDGTHCTLREAIFAANSGGGNATIVFDDALALQVIHPVIDLPVVARDAIIIDGLVRTGVLTYRMELDGETNERSKGLMVTGSTCSVMSMEIFGFSNSGISLEGNANTVENCMVGIDTGGTNPGSGNSIGIAIDAVNDNVIGGTAVGAGNYCSFNTNQGIHIGLPPGTAIGNELLGNQIGSYGAGGNQDFGVSLDGASNTVIGTTDGPNVISGNNHSGLYSSFTAGTTVRANSIGIGPTGDPMGNGVLGLLFFESTGSWIIGGNSVAYNRDAGVIVSGDTSIGNWIADNSIFDNTLMGIDLGGDGETANDQGDGDTGPNGFQNFPVITAANAETGEVEATLNTDGAPGTDYTIYFFENTSCGVGGYGQGETHLGTTTVTMPASGDAVISFTLPPLTGGKFLTAIASRVDNRDTSEFSQCFEIPAGADSIFFDGFESGGTTAWTETVGGP